MNSSENTLFLLLQAALDNEVAESVPSDIDWRRVMELSFDQGIVAMLIDGIDKVTKTKPNIAEALDSLDSPEFEDLKYGWFGNVFQAEEDYKKYQSAIEGFLKLCKGQHVDVLLLKGYGLSLNYPIPSHRPCGDIDIYINGNEDENPLPSWKRINDLMRERGIEVNDDNPHHSVFSFGGFTFENHITLLDVERHRNHFSDEQVFQKLIAEGCDEIDVGDERCFVPSVKLNSVYLLRHMAHHFSVEKITLRHILDWALFVRANALKIDWDFVYGYAKDSGCSPFLNCLNGICVESLGFDTKDFPVRIKNEKSQSRMLADILSPEFKEDIPNVSNKLKYCIVKTRRIIANRWKYFMVSDERIVTTIFNLAKKKIHL